MILDQNFRHFRKNHVGAQFLEHIPQDQSIELSVYLRRRASVSSVSDELQLQKRLSRQEYQEAFGASAEEIDRVEQYFRNAGFEVLESDVARRRIVIQGSTEALERAFAVRLGRYQDWSKEIYIAPAAEIQIPEELRDIVIDVLGMDTSSQAKTNFRPAVSPSTSYKPAQVAKAYNFPAHLDGTGECVALIELGGGFVSGDITNYFSQVGLTPPEVIAVSVDGGSNAPGSPNGPDGEVMLDIEIVGSVAPSAKIAVYFAPNTNQGFIDAVSQATHDKVNSPSVISISWGAPENSWSSSSLSLMEQVISEANLLGITVTVAAGDNGSTDGVTDGMQHVDFPASAPHSLACGGTTLVLDYAGTIVSEVVWNDLSSGGGATGGGVSEIFALPTYQSTAMVPPSVNAGGFRGRGVPDVAGNADPNTGYEILVDGSNMVVGGTSAVAPLLAGLVILFNQALGKGQGFVQPAWYPLAEKNVSLPIPAFRDIVSGSNGAYTAAPGWDPCTGLGSPNGSVIASLLGLTK